MPTAPQVSYPGVYVQEIPSGVRTITGVPTSITAFIGRAPRGPINDPVTIFNYGDYERAFGGLHQDSTMSYAVRDFFNNGGGQAIIVRLYNTPPQGDDTAQPSEEEQDPAAAVKEATDQIDALITSLEQDDDGADVGETMSTTRQEITEAIAAIETGQAGIPLKEKLEAAKKQLQDAGDDPEKQKGALKAILNALTQSTSGSPDAPPPAPGGTAVSADGFLSASSPGEWGNSLKLSFTQVANQDILDKYGLGQGDLFDVAIFEGEAKTASETIRNVSVKESQRRIDRVLTKESSLVQVSNYDETWAPSEEGITLSGGAPSARLDPAAYQGNEEHKTGIHALAKADLFNILCVPPDTRDGDLDASLHSLFTGFCVAHRAIYIIDPPTSWSANKATAANKAKEGFLNNELAVSGEAGRNAAIYFPRVVLADPLREGQPDTFPACGMIAGVMARTDGTRGVWKAPAGLDAALSGIRGLDVNLTDMENGILNPLGINCLRTFPGMGSVIWGARTLRGNDQLGDEYKYLPVRRLALFIEETLFRSTQWAVFEPNDEPLWSQLRLNIGTFMHDLFRQGAFQGGKPSDAYFVRCDSSTTTQSDINKGIVNIMVGFAPLKPAEFVVIYLQQMAGNLAT